MKRTSKYVGLDVHQATTVATVREASRRVIARSILPTEATTLVEFFSALEEGNQAQWLYDLLSPLVQRVVVCDRRGSRTRVCAGQSRVICLPGS